MVACQWNKSSPTGPALQFAGGSFFKSSNSFIIRFDAIFKQNCQTFSDLPSKAAQARSRSQPMHALKRYEQRLTNSVTYGCWLKQDAAFVS